MTTGQSLEDEITQAGGPVSMLRHAAAGTYPYPIPDEFTNWRDEQASWAHTAVLFDQSRHMTDVRFRGPDVRRLMSEVGVNSFATFGAHKAKQFVACTEDGHFIGDAILFGLADDEYSLVGAPTTPHWVAYQAETGGYDVEVLRDERSVANPAARRLYRYQLQGPEALKIVEKATGGTLPRIKFFNIGEIVIDGLRVQALNHTMVGIPGQEMTGLEMWGPAPDGDRVLAALLAAGEEFGMRQGGAIAYAGTAVESGWLGLPVPAIYSGDAMKAYRQSLPGDGYEASASLGGSFVADDIEDYYLEPWDLGYGRLIKFDHEFIGRSALEEAAGEPHRQKVWLRWHDADVARVIASSLFDGPCRAKYLKVPYGVYATFQDDAVVADGRVVGLSSRNGYTVNVGGWSSLAVLDEEHARDGAQVSVVWGEPDGGGSKPGVESHVPTEIRATVSTTPLI